MPKAPKGTAAAPATVSRPHPGDYDPARDGTAGAGVPGQDPWVNTATADDPGADGWPAGTQVITVPPVEKLMAGQDAAVEAERQFQEGPGGDGAVPAPAAVEGAPVPAEGSEAAGEAPVAQETQPEKLGAARVDADPADIDPGVKPTGKITKAAPAKRAKPTPVVAAHQGEMAMATTGLQLANLEDGEEQVNLLLYGPEGTGKTTGIATAANHGRILVINAEGGLKTTPLKKRGVNTSNIVIFPPPGHPEMLTVDNLERLFWQVAAELHDDPTAWYAVCWDSITEVVTKLLRDVVEREVAKNALLPESSAKRQAHRETADFTDRSDYGVVSNQVLPLLRKYRDLPCHFLVTALERRDVDDDTGRVMYGPNTTPAIQTALLGYVDLAIRVQNTAGENDVVPHFVGRTRPARTTRAKDRFDVTPPVMDNPTFERVLQYLNGDLVWDAEAEAAAQAAMEAAAHPAPAEPAKPTGKRAPAKKAAAPAAATT